MRWTKAELEQALVDGFALSCHTYIDTLGRTRHAASALVRFQRRIRVDAATGCWLWTGALHGNGYGVLRVGSHVDGSAHNILAHRFSYLVHVGPVPQSFELDHLCRNRACANPAHLEPVTHRTNGLRGNGVGAAAARREHCPAGHPYDLLNTRVNGDGHRRCRTCHREDERQRRQARALVK